MVHVEVSYEVLVDLFAKNSELAPRLAQVTSFWGEKKIMISFRLIAVAATLIAAAATATPASAQAAPGGPAPGTGNGAAMVANSRDENSAYNRIIGKVGADPVKTEQAQRAAKLRAVPANPADVVPGAAVRDIKGVALGRVEKIDGDSAVLAFNSGKIRFPLIGFGKDANGLLINLTREDFLARVAKSKASS
ncbi:MAG: hypothetical protein ABIQ32_13385 [Sphingomicrobium sp.]